MNDAAPVQTEIAAAVETPAPVAPAPPAPPASLISGADAPAPADAPVAEAPVATAAPVEPPAPVTLEALKFPEGVTPDAEALNQFLEIVNTDGLSRAEMAQKFIDLQIGASEKANVAAAEAAQTLWDQTQSEWMTACRNLPEIGGDKLPTTLAEIKRGLQSAGANAETFQALDLTGAGSHPAVVQLMHRLVQPFLERTPVAGQPPKGSFSAADRLYPTMQTKE